MEILIKSTLMSSIFKLDNYTDQKISFNHIFHILEVNHIIMFYLIHLYYYFSIYSFNTLTNTIVIIDFVSLQNVDTELRTLQQTVGSWSVLQEWEGWKFPWHHNTKQNDHVVPRRRGTLQPAVRTTFLLWHLDLVFYVVICWVMARYSKLLIVSPWRSFCVGWVEL